MFPHGMIVWDRLMIPSLVEYLVYLYESSVDCEYHRLHRQKMIDGSNWSTKDGGKKRKRRQFGTRKSRGEETPKNHRIARTSMMLQRRGDVGGVERAHVEPTRSSNPNGEGRLAKLTPSWHDWFRIYYYWICSAPIVAEEGWTERISDQMWTGIYLCDICMMWFHVQQ